MDTICRFLLKCGIHSNVQKPKVPFQPGMPLQSSEVEGGRIAPAGGHGSCWLRRRQCHPSLISYHLHISNGERPFWWHQIYVVEMPQTITRYYVGKDIQRSRNYSGAHFRGHWIYFQKTHLVWNHISTPIQRDKRILFDEWGIEKSIILTWRVHMHEKTRCNNEIAQDKHQAFQIIWLPFLQERMQSLWSHKSR